MSMEQGAEARTQSNVTYVNLHSGQLSRTMSAKYVLKNQLEKVVETWRKYSTKNKADEEFHYYALDFPRITGFVTNVKFFSKPLGDTVKTGYHIFVDCGKSGMFCIELSPNDQYAYRIFMSRLMNTNLKQMCQFGGFTNDKGRKVFVIWQENEADDIAPVKPLYREQWLSDLVYQKIKTNTPLTDEEKMRLAINEDGSIDKLYPYVRERKNPTSQKMEWNFDKWQEFLNEKFDEIAQPKIDEAKALHQRFTEERVINNAPADTSDNAYPLPEFAGMPDNVAMDDDDIPFGLIIGLGAIGLSAIQLLANFNALLG